MSSAAVASIIWIGLAGAGVAVEVTARAGGAGVGLGTALGRLRNHRLGRAALVIFWAWIGWHVFAR